MELNPDSLEAVLRRAPVPRPPADLKAKLLRGVHEGVDRSPTASRAAGNIRVPDSVDGGWRRWLLLFLPAGMAAALATVAVVQKDQIRDLRTELQALASAEVQATASEADSGGNAGRSVMGLPDERSEIVRLRELLAKLKEDAATVAKLESENAQLKQAIAAARASMPAEFKELEDAKDRANRIMCVNNLKQMGLSVRVYATDNGDEFPPDILAMKDVLTTPKMLVCPSDTTRSAAESWETYSAANFSYEFLSPGPGKHEAEPNRILFRCPIHGHVGMCDGSVQQGIAKEHPEWLVSRNGALYLEGRPEPTSASASGNRPTTVVPERRLMSVGGKGGAPVTGGMPEELARRYGLFTGSGTTQADGRGTVQVLDLRSSPLPVDAQGNPITVVPLPVIDANGNVVGEIDPGTFVPVPEGGAEVLVEEPVEIVEPKP